MLNFTMDQPEYLYRLARSATSEDRQNLSEAITSILATSLTERQQEIASDILLTIIKEAETDLRQQLSQRLSVEESVTQELIEYLAKDDEFCVAEPVIIHSPKLTETFLINLVKERTEEYWRAVAKRRKISTELATLLIGMSDDETLKILVSNPGAAIDNTSINWLVGVAKNFIDIQEPVLMRPEIDQKMATELYWYVSKNLRQKIVDEFHVQPNKIDQALEEIMQNQIHVKTGKGDITADMKAYVERLQQRGRITPHFMIETIRKRNLPLFKCMLGQAVNLSKQLIDTALNQKDGRALATILRSYGMTKSDFTTIYLLIRSQKEESRVTNSSELSALMTHYDNMTVSSANLVLNRWREESE